MNTEEASTSKNTPTTPTNYDESITTSSESDTFETWTLVTDKKMSKEKSSKPTSTPTKNDNNRVEILNKLDDVPEQKEVEQKAAKQGVEKEPKPEQDSSADDLSDGISVISECESAGRVSPHPYLREQLNNLNLKAGAAGIEFGTVRPQLTPPNSPLLPTPVNSENQLRNRAPKTESTAIAENNVENNVEQPRRPGIGRAILNHFIVRRILNTIFYVGVGLAILAVVARFANPELRRLNKSKSLLALQEKFKDLSLQNNLMRAEIDFLTKQVNYLHAINENGLARNMRPKQNYKHSAVWQQERPNIKSFKAWSGQGNSMEPVDINKVDLKTPYKCADGKFAENAGMCVENAPNGKPIVDQMGAVVNDVVEDSDALKTLKSAAEQLDALKENPFEEMPKFKETPSTNAQKKAENFKNERNSDRNNEDWARKQNGRWEDNKKQEKYAEKPKKIGETSKESSSSERYNKIKRSKYYIHRGSYEILEDDDDDNLDDDNDSDDNSYERFTKHVPKHEKAKYEENNSKYEKQRRYKDSSRERYQKAGSDWHNKLMLHRENARRQNDRQFNDKNWYIKRANGRERIRVDDIKFR